LATLDSLAIGEASVALLQAQSTDRAAEADFKRASALNAEEIIAQKDFLRLKAERERAAVALRAAEDRLKLLGVDPKRLSRVESTFPLTAPLTGTVVQKKATVGELGTPSDPLFTVADLSTVWVEANLTENQLGKVRPGVAAGVVVAAYPDQTFQ
ncbi:efflux RND transporter periplasmic adaptor subunit, partial [Escherichia coli]